MKKLTLIFTGAFFSLGLLVGCQQQPSSSGKTLTSQGQEGHGGDIAVTRVLGQAYLQMSATPQAAIPTPLEAYLKGTSTDLPIYSSTEDNGKLMVWEEKRGRTVLRLNRERIRTVDEFTLAEEVSLLLTGTKQNPALRYHSAPNLVFINKMAPISPESEASAIFHEAAFNLASSLSYCSSVAVPLNVVQTRMVEARDEMINLFPSFFSKVAKVTVLRSLGPVFDATTGFEVDAVTVEIAKNVWHTYVNVARLVGWEDHPASMSMFTGHEYAHTFGLKSHDFSYFYANSLIRCY